jgi:membrane protein
MNWLIKILAGFKPIQQILIWSRNTTLPGFDRLPIYTVTEFFLNEIKKESLNVKAASLAYNFMLAIFPATIFLFTLIPYIPIYNFQDQLMYLLLQILPKNAFLAIETTLEDIIKNQNSGLLSFGFITALFFSTNGVLALMNSFNKASLVLETRTGFKKRLVAIALTLFTSLLIIIGIAVIVAGEIVVQYMKDVNIVKDGFTIYSLFILRWVIIMALFLSIISSLYYYGPARTKNFRFISAGSTLATFLILLTSLGFAFYVNNFSSYNKIYGSIGTLIVIMMWFYINSVILLVGFELNASINIIKRNLPPVPEPRKKNQLKEKQVS